MSSSSGDRVPLSQSLGQGVASYGATDNPEAERRGDRERTESVGEAVCACAGWCGCGRACVRVCACECMGGCALMRRCG